MALTVNRVLQWTLEQWAEAAGWCEEREQYLPMPNLDGLLDLQQLWLTHRPGSDGPAGTLLYFAAGVKPMNFAWAARAMRRAALDCFPSTWSSK